MGIIFDIYEEVRDDDDIYTEFSVCSEVAFYLLEDLN